MPKFAANLSLMFTEHPFLERFELAAGAGFEAVEFLFPYEYDVSTLSKRLSDHNLELVLFNIFPGDWQAGMRGLAALQGREAEFKAAVEQAVRYADQLGCRQLHAMAGLIEHGADEQTYIENLRLACEIAAPHGITILIEPINTEDMPGYYLAQTEVAADIMRRVGAENIGLQFDLYHRHKMQGAVAQAIEDYAAITRHYQCAAPRDRGEPDRVDLDYRDIFQIIDASGFKGWIGCEYRPRGKTEDGLSWRQEVLSTAQG